MKKILFSLIAILVCVGLVGGAFAYFSDTDTSSGNTFTAGTLDLCMKTSGPADWDYDYTGPIATASGMAPGVEEGPFEVRFKNCGTMDGKVTVCFGYGEYDVPSEEQYGEFANLNVGPNIFAKNLIVTQAYLDYSAYGAYGIALGNKALFWGDDLVTQNANAVADGWVVAVDGGGYLPTIFGLTEGDCLHFNGEPGSEDEGNRVRWSPGEAHQEVFWMKLDEGVTSNFEFDGIQVFMYSTLLQYDAPESP